ncbi:hypothetical protein PAESOLCIP111_03386 [Paenibacillus solanacearum]|uniref:DUF3892 domain-containing protein n=1 Tax=Paenibacillus solanacearum TaxID=2048548 RepID=A0A916K581_9BACL|nr:DUF3892 domain-containing protein [Paenibacillus solanacearum]CAG7632500.1 hypothetical protein PAESOLCIP111_03386 [Paenibacillus solanacearum]
MPRRRKSVGTTFQGTFNDIGTNQQAGTGAARGYQDAEEATHNGNFAWNGQPIPEFKPYGQGATGYGSSSVTQTGGWQSSAAGTVQSPYSNGPTAGAWQGNAAGAAQSPYSNGTTAGAWQGSSAAGVVQSPYSNDTTAGAWQGSSTAGTAQSPYGQPPVQPQPAMAQARNVGGQTFQGGMPIPGSSGDPNAAYGSRNTGINHADARNVGFQGGYTGYGPNGQPVQYGTFMRDGTQYGKGPHTIDPNKAIIQAVHYEGGGIAAVKFQDGSVADVATAIGMAEAGLIEDVNTGKNREGQKTLRSYPDGDPSNNLSNLPRF